MGPIMCVALGRGLVFVPVSLVALVKVPDNDTGVASSLMNAGQQVGGSIGLAVLGTVAWSAVASNFKSAVSAAGPAAASKAQQAALYNHSLAYCFSHGYWASAGVSALAQLTALALTRVRPSGLSVVNPMMGG